MATENIPSRLHCVAEGNVLAGANEILDDDKGKKQTVINQENDQRLETLETAVGTGGSVDSRIESAKTEIVGGASPYCDTLGKAEALISTNANDIAVLQEAYAALTQNDVVIVAPSDTWPVAAPAQNIIYRVVDRTNTPPQYYTDYMWNGTAMVEMAQYNNAIDAVPTAGSHNLVESGGVQNELALGAVYDVSAKNPTAGPNSDGKWESISALLSDANLNTLIPVAWRKGGMSIKFIQSYDNKYVQYRLMSDEWSTNTEDWAISDDGVYVENSEFVEVHTDAEDKILWAIQKDGNVYYGAGCPQQVKDYIEEKISSLSLDEYEDIVAFLSDYLESDTTLKVMIDSINNQISTKLDAEGLDPEALATEQTVENPEYIQVTTDSEDKILEGITSEGVKQINLSIDTPSAIIEHVENPEFLNIKVDKDGKIISGTKEDGTTYISQLYGKKANIGVLDLSVDGQNKLKKDLGIAVPSITVIDVYPNNSIPCQIANLIRSITDASADKQYKILVHSGTYAETDIVTKDYIDIIGENYEDTILVHDGDATYDSPDNYSMGEEYSNIPVNTIPWLYKHLIVHLSNSIVKNLTLKTVGGQCKYICHQDGAPGSKFNAIFEHCNFVNGSGTNVLGVGSYENQYFKYIDCQFVDNKNQDTEGTHSFNLHNQYNRSAPGGLRFENCSFIHTGWIHVLELGSGQTDYYEFINCVCNNERTFIRFRATSEEDSYSIILRVIGGNMGGIAPDGIRPNTKLSIQSRFINLIYNPATIPFGTPLYNNAPAANANNGFVFKLSDVDSDYNMKTVSTYDVGFGLAEAGNYAYGDNLYINNGKFTKTVNGNIAGTVKQAIELSEEGYVMVQKNQN